MQDLVSESLLINRAALGTLGALEPDETLDVLWRTLAGAGAGELMTLLNSSTTSAKKTSENN